MEGGEWMRIFEVMWAERYVIVAFSIIASGVYLAGVIFGR
jgi:hypothetical protein